MAEIISLGKIDLQLFEGKFGNILTDEVIITNERIKHIQNHHLEDYDLFKLYGKDCVQFCYDILENKGE